MCMRHISIFNSMYEINFNCVSLFSVGDHLPEFRGIQSNRVYLDHFILFALLKWVQQGAHCVTINFLFSLSHTHSLVGRCSFAFAIRMRHGVMARTLSLPRFDVHISINFAKRLCLTQMQQIASGTHLNKRPMNKGRKNTRLVQWPRKTARKKLKLNFNILY